MRIIKAAHLGMCFGVRDAIELALDQSKSASPTVLGDLVHNPTVLNHLKSHGVQFASSIDGINTGTAIVTAHGTSDRTLSELHQRGFKVVEATCPLVRFAHKTIAGLAAQGWHPIIIGKRDHIEVRGLTDDLEACDIVLTEEDVGTLQHHPRLGIASQTTQPINHVQHLVSLIRKRFPASEVRFVDTVCQPTKQRQTAAEELAREADVIIVIGGANSNNTHELVKTCAASCDRVYLVQTAADLHSTWFNSNDCIGVTAGTSTPDQTINEVTGWLDDLASFQNQLAQHLAQRNQ